jgi:Flp pilus assembly protein TadB
VLLGLPVTFAFSVALVLYLVGFYLAVSSCVIVGALVLAERSLRRRSDRKNERAAMRLANGLELEAEDARARECGVYR